jgi:hypothetical protein
MCRSLRPILDFLAEPLSRHNSIQQLTEKNNNSAVIITICLLPDNQSLTTLIAIMFAAFPPPNTNSSRDSTPQMPLRSCRDSTPQMPRRSSMPDYGCEDMDAIRKLNSTPQMPLRSCRDSIPQMPRRSSSTDAKIWTLSESSTNTCIVLVANTQPCVVKEAHLDGFSKLRDRLRANETSPTHCHPYRPGSRKIRNGVRVFKP